MTEQEIPKKIELTEALIKNGVTQLDVNFYNRFVAILGVEDVFELAERNVKWERGELFDEFLYTVRALEIETGEYFGLENITWEFLTDAELNDVSDDEKERMRAKYGDYIVANTAGNCRPKPDGGYHIQLGIVGEEENYTRAEVIGLMGHELGHAVTGTLLHDPTLEELKAYLFSSIVEDRMRTVDVSFEEDITRTHTRARMKREQIRDMHIPEAAAIARLIGRPFMGAEQAPIGFDYP